MIGRGASNAKAFLQRFHCRLDVKEHNIMLSASEQAKLEPAKVEIERLAREFVGRKC